MKKSTRLITAFLVVTAVFAGCKKYEEGPAFSLLPKKSRLVNDWKFESYLVNGVDKTTDYKKLINDIQVSIKKDGTYSTTTQTLAGSGTETGKWEWANDKEVLVLTEDDKNSTKESWNILRLKNKELWVYQMSGNDKVEFHYTSK